jgi:hypothetical protein
MLLFFVFFLQFVPLHNNVLIKRHFFVNWYWKNTRKLIEINITMPENWSNVLCETLPILLIFLKYPISVHPNLENGYL